MRGSTLYICFSLLRQDTVATITIWAEVGGFWRVVLQLRHRQLATEKESSRKRWRRRRDQTEKCKPVPLQLELAAWSWKGGWLGERWSLFWSPVFDDITSKCFSIVFPFLIELRVCIPEAWTRSWKRCQRMTSSLKCLSWCMIRRGKNRLRLSLRLSYTRCHLSW